MISEIAKIQTLEDLVAFIKNLSVDLKTEKDTWQNWELSAYLEAIAAQLTDSKGQNIDQYENKYQAIAAALFAGKVYE